MWASDESKRSAKVLEQARFIAFAASIFGCLPLSGSALGIALNVCPYSPFVSDNILSGPARRRPRFLFIFSLSITVPSFFFYFIFFRLPFNFFPIFHTRSKYYILFFPIRFYIHFHIAQGLEGFFLYRHEMKKTHTPRFRTNTYFQWLHRRYQYQRLFSNEINLSIRWWDDETLAGFLRRVSWDGMLNLHFCTLNGRKNIIAEIDLGTSVRIRNVRDRRNNRSISTCGKRILA